MSELIEATRLVLICWAISIASIVGSTIAVGIVNTRGKRQEQKVESE